MHRQAPTRGTGPRRGRPPGLRAAAATAALFLALVAGLVALDRVPPLVLVGYVLVSIIAFVLYRSDKAAAVRGAWRVPEARLHAVALVGGWPGALVAQRAFRHKTTKQPFRTVFWGTVVANCLALAWFVLGMPGLG